MSNQTPRTLATQKEEDKLKAAALKEARSEVEAYRKASLDFEKAINCSSAAEAGSANAARDAAEVTLKHRVGEFLKSKGIGQDIATRERAAHGQPVALTDAIVNDAKTNAAKEALKVTHPAGGEIASCPITPRVAPLSAQRPGKGQG